MKTLVLLAVITLLLTVPALWLLLRHHSRIASAAASALLLTATATGYIGFRLWQEARAVRPPPFTYSALPGHFQVIAPSQLPAALVASRGRPVLLEFYADWCSACQVWKNTVFNRPDVQAVLHPLALLQVDASELDPEVQQLLDRYRLQGLPAILVYDRNGREHPELRLLGEMSAPDFIRWIQGQLLATL